MNNIHKIDEIHDLLQKKIEEKSNNYHNISKLWLYYLKKQTLMYKNTIMKINAFLENIHTIEHDLTRENLVLIYLLLNNNINS